MRMGDVYYVIVDPARRPDELDGFAVNDPIEGWIFTWLPEHATRFDTATAARRTIAIAYQKQPWLSIRKVEV